MAGNKVHMLTVPPFVTATVKSPAVIDEKLEAVGEAAMPPPEDCGKFLFSNFHNLCFNPDAFSFAKIWTTVCLNPILLRTT